MRGVVLQRISRHGRRYQSGNVQLRMESANLYIHPQKQEHHPCSHAYSSCHQSPYIEMNNYCQAWWHKARPRHSSFHPYLPNDGRHPVMSMVQSHGWGILHIYMSSYRILLVSIRWHIQADNLFSLLTCWTIFGQTHLLYLWIKTWIERLVRQARVWLPGEK